MKNSTEKQTIHRLMRVNRLHRSLVEKTMGEAGLHRSQHLMLIYLKNCTAAPSQKEIAASFDVTPAAVAMSLNKLEEKGYIERFHIGDDRRTNYVRISEKGAGVLEQTRAMCEEADKAMFKDIGAEDIEKLTELLDKMKDNLLSIGAEDICTSQLQRAKMGLSHK